MAEYPKDHESLGKWHEDAHKGDDHEHLKRHREYWEGRKAHHGKHLANAADCHTSPDKEKDVYDLILEIVCDGDHDDLAAAILHGGACMHAINELKMYEHHT